MHGVGIAIGNIKMKVYLYGAGIIAYGAYKAIKTVYDCTIEGFLVSDKSGQPRQIEGIPVYLPEECGNDLSECLIVIATPEEYHDSIERHLIQLQFLNYRKLDSHLEYDLMGRYLKEKIQSSLIEDHSIERTVECSNDVCVYMAVSHKDKKLNRTYDEEPWVKKIQVGAALTDIRISELTDEGEDSLSAENAIYGELSATYYAWKYNRCGITGLFHYRRILRITKEQLSLLEINKVDVILPLPFVCCPDASGQYGRYILSQDIEVMKNVLKEWEADEYESFIAILDNPYLYNYNMLIARKEVFDDYCSWLFPLLKEITDRCEKVERKRMPRYIGRIGEVLTSLYFIRNKKNWNITHGEKIWRA